LNSFARGSTQQALSVNIAGGVDSVTRYTIEMLTEICHRFGVEIRSAEDAGALWVSVCDPDDMPAVVHARSIAKGRPVIMGGFEGYFGVPYLNWVDAVVVGEGLEFISTWAKSPEAAMNLPCVLKRDSKEVFPSYSVPYAYSPLLRLSGGTLFYYLGGRGCKGKCGFCATSWVQPYTQCPDKYIDKVISMVESMPNGKLALISNDSNFKNRSKIITAQSVRIVDYLKDPLAYKSNMNHFGVEGWTAEQRRKFSKPITDEQIQEVVIKTEAAKQQCELFMIVGYPGWSMVDVENFAAMFPHSLKNSPKIYVKCTYFDPCPHTPLSGSAVNPEFCNIPEVFKIFNSRSKRVRVFPTRSAGRSAWRTVLHRCTPDQAGILGPQPKTTNCPEAFELFKKNISATGLAHLLDEFKDNPNNVIKCSVRKAL